MIRTWLVSSAAPSAAIASGLAMAHSYKYRGARRSLLFAVLGLCLPAMGEFIGVNWMRAVRHHARPQVKGVPVGAVLSWYAITYGTFSSLESIWSGRRLSAMQRRIVLPASTAVAATSLDLLLDCFGLDVGMWEWAEHGSYACEIRGANGKRGIPLSNFTAWLILTSAVSLLYLSLAPDDTPESSDPSAESPEAGRQAARLLLSYYVPAALWAVWRWKPRYLLYSALFPLMLRRALTGGRSGNRTV